MLEASKIRNNEEKKMSTEDQAKIWQLVGVPMLTHANTFPPRTEHVRPQVYENAKELWVNLQYYNKLRYFDPERVGPIFHGDGL